MTGVTLHSRVHYEKVTLRGAAQPDLLLKEGAEGLGVREKPTGVPRS